MGFMAHVLLFSSDLELAQGTLVDYYSLRFQIEFNFRDAKQFWGLRPVVLMYYGTESLPPLDLDRRLHRFLHRLALARFPYSDCAWLLCF